MRRMAQTSAVLLRLGTALGLCLGLTLIGPTAQAAVHQHGDAVGDTSLRDVPGTTSGTTSGMARGRAAVPAAASGLGDITSLVVGHQYDTVDVLVSMVDLSPTGDAVAVRVRLVTPSGGWSVRVADRKRGGAFSRVVRMRAHGEPGTIDCEQLTATMDYALDSVTVRVPRVCLGGDPAWVRVGATSRLREGRRVQFDDAQRDGLAPRRTTLSRRIVA